MLYAAAITVPLVAALQRFAVSYGYQGATKSEAFRSARSVWIIASFAAAAFCLPY